MSEHILDKIKSLDFQLTDLVNNFFEGYIPANPLYLPSLIPVFAKVGTYNLLFLLLVLPFKIVFPFSRKLNIVLITLLLGLIALIFAIFLGLFALLFA